MPDYPPLMPSPGNLWQAEFDQLARDRYMARKYDRDKRLRSKMVYITERVPEVREASGLVVDVGPGPGEFLELCRWIRPRDVRVFGVESPGGAGGMGDAYWQLSRMMHERQRIECSYVGWQRYVRYVLTCEGLCDGVAALVNFQGSWAQCYADFLLGPPHDEHHDAKRQAWRFGRELTSAWSEAFRAIHKWLKPGGHCVIWANGTGDAACRRQYYDTVLRVAEVAGLALTAGEPPSFTKWRKP